jgi:Predicted membrane protein (DUF2142)
MIARARAAARRVGAAAWLCALAATLNAVAWGLITPPFHVPDEPQHAAYAQYLAETGSLPPRAGADVFSSDESAAFGTTRFNAVVGNGAGRPKWTAAEARERERDLAPDFSPSDGGGESNVTVYPPAAYALYAPGYWAGAALGHGFLDALAAMRLVSALLAGLTTLFVFLFLREALPRARWAWAVGALAAGVQPVFGFMSGGVSNDDLLIAAAAASFFAMARIFARGLTLQRALGLAAAIGVGALAKTQMLALVPGFALGILAVLARLPAEERWRGLRDAAAAAGLLGAVIVGYIGVNAVILDRASTGGAGVLEPTANAGSLAEKLSYAWQLYLPRLPFQTDLLPGVPFWDDWFTGFVGRFGWLDYDFPPWASQLAGGIAVALVALAVAGVWSRRGSVRRRWTEAASYAVAAAGLAAAIAAVGFGYQRSTGFDFQQARYLLPLLPLYGAFIALAARGAGARWGRTAGAAIVVLALGHGLFAQILTLERYYV